MKFTGLTADSKGSMIGFQAEKKNIFPVLCGQDAERAIQKKYERR
jgi:hypothetical protein